MKRQINIQYAMIMPGFRFFFFENALEYKVAKRQEIVFFLTPWKIASKPQIKLSN